MTLKVDVPTELDVESNGQQTRKVSHARGSSFSINTNLKIDFEHFRMEGLAITHYHGMAKVLGSVIVLSGAMVFTFIKGPPLPTVLQNEGLGHSAKRRSTEDWIKGSCLELASNLTWSVWLIMQSHIIKQYPAKLRLKTMQCCFSCIGSVILGAVAERDISSWKLGWDIGLVSMIYCGLLVTAVSYWLQVWVVDKKGPVFTAMFRPLALVLTAVMSVILSVALGDFCGGGGIPMLIPADVYVE
ncbi:hypothetical protein RJ639_022713 [Escallonia herrerae]|uniref:WAT1-related protein n=1 Tax=Escallonia herrerae TaxID=1293975 RepID=A0AA88UYI3_9ASTE|nr:hypothetical protein RJ639_022713 [Escallonia herrerae]